LDLVSVDFLANAWVDFGGSLGVTGGRLFLMMISSATDLVSIDFLTNAWVDWSDFLVAHWGDWRKDPFDDQRQCLEV
jgi:hypothetical protein